MEPMLTWTCQPYSGQTDLQAMTELLVAVRPAAWLSDCPGPADLIEAMALPAIRANTCLWWAAGGRLLAFATVDAHRNLWFEMAREIWRDAAAASQGAASQVTGLQGIGLGVAGQVIAGQVIAWGESCVRRSVGEVTGAATVDAVCREEEAGRIALLEQNGFVRQELRTLRMVRSLKGGLPVPQVPKGYRIRRVAGEQEVEALVALGRAAFASESMAVEERLAMMRLPEYDPNLDLVAVTLEDRMVAYCACAINEEDNARAGRREGFVDPVAAHPDFRRLGLARALLLAGLSLLKKRGMETAVLSMSSRNTAMQGLARDLGFRLEVARVWFSKKIS
jgi:ribosomal protein S18 acetylase RimI-like enzyme